MEFETVACGYFYYDSSDVNKQESKHNFRKTGVSEAVPAGCHRGVTEVSLQDSRMAEH